jgi:putative glutamine amidotransferase
VTQPMIGVTTYRDLTNQGYPRFSASEAYTTSLARAGAIPILIPLGLPQADILALLDRLDGLLFSGGGDIDPRAYGHPPHPLVKETDLDRDQLEFELLKATIQKGTPFLGICRGLQVVNVALGGTLYEDIREQEPHPIEHAYYPDYRREFLAHPVRVEPESHLAGILAGAEFQVNSLHHQGICQLAPGLSPTAHAPDGLVEAFELPDYPYGLAVQWHPENLQDQPSMRALFRSLVEASEREGHLS